MISIDWVPCEPPRAPRYVVGRGNVARALASRVIEGDTPVLGLVGHELLVVGCDSLPWVDGAVYVSCDPAAPSLLFDTRIRPEQPVDLVAASVRRRVGGPAIWLVEPELLVPLAALDMLHIPLLVDWLERSS